MAYKLNSLAEKVRSMLGGIPQSLNQIGRNVMDNQGVYQQGQFKPLQAIPQYNQANTAIKNKVVIPTLKATNNFINQAPQQVGKFASENILQPAFKNYIYNPENPPDQQVFPSGLYAKTSKRTEIGKQYGFNSPQYSQAQFSDNLDLVSNFDGGITAGATKALTRNSRQVIKIHPDDMKVMKDFASNVDRLGDKANKINFGQLGKDAQNLVEHYFGDKWKTLSNRKIAQLFDYALAKREGGLVVEPKGVQIPMGLQSQEVEGLTQQAMKNLTPQQQVAKAKLPKIMFDTDKQVTNTALKADDLLPWESSKPISEELNYTPLKSFETKAKKVFNSPQELQDDIKKTARSVDSKVNLLDYLRTPDRVLEKIGLKKESDLIKKQYNTYLDELPKEIDKVTKWYDRVKANPGAEQRIFKYLDGQGTRLEGEELKVAEEMRSYLEDWAVKLKLPEDKRIASYITHIFEKDFIKKEFDEDLAKIISEKLPGSVYDPFLQQRLGKQGYVEDVFRALDAYVKRATRKFNMDPALEQLRSKEGSLDLDSWKYVKSYTDRINLRPTELDNLLDNLIKSSPIGYKLGQRPTTALTQGFRQMVYRATLGLNVSSALRNLSQGANTYAKLGEQYTGIGYYKAIKSLLTGDDELLRSGVLRDNMIQDRTITATRGLIEKLDSGLWMFFNLAEKINRGAAYYGAKSRALSKGLSEEQAQKAGFDMARQTQFTFSSVDTPVALQGDIAKTALQFQSYSTKQTEFISELVKNKEYKNIARYIAGNLAMVYSIGQLFGMKPTDMIPFFNQIEGLATGENSDGRVPKSPLQTIGTGVASIPGVFSQDEAVQRKSQDNIEKAGALMIPAGTQIRKTLRGVTDSAQGFNTSLSGRIRFPVKQDAVSKVRMGTFGTYNEKEARDYFDNKKTPLGEKQTERVKLSDDKSEAYQNIMKEREENKIKKATQEPSKKKKKEINIEEPIEVPEYTGNTELDKKLTSKYKSSVTKRANDIVTLYQEGKLTQDQAEAKLRELDNKNKSDVKQTKPRAKRRTKISFGKVPTIKVPRISLNFKLPKLAKIKTPKFGKLARLTKDKKTRTMRIKV